MLLQHIFRAYARRIDGQREFGLRFISRRSRRPRWNRLSLSLRSFRTLFSLLRRARLVHPLADRGVIHLPTLRIRIRRPDASCTAISLCRSALSSFSPPPHSSDTCAKSEWEAHGIGCYLRRRWRRGASIRRILGSPRIPSTISEFMRIRPREQRSTDRRDVLRNSARFINSLDELRRVLEKQGV